MCDIHATHYVRYSPRMSGANTVFIVSLAIIALGYLLKRLGVFREADGQILARAVLNLTLPAVFLSTVPQIPLDASLLLFPAVCLAHCGLLLLAGLRLFRSQEPRAKGALLMASLGFNNGLFAFPIVQAIWGVQGVQYLAMFDIGNALVLLGANQAIASWYSARASGREPMLSAGFVLRKLGTSVPLITFAIAIAMNLAALRLPSVAAALVDTLSRANMPVVLLLLGVYFDPRLGLREIKNVLASVGLRYAAGIGVGVLLFLLLPFDAEYRTLMLVALVLPVGATVVPFAAAYDLDHRLAGVCSNLTLVVSFALLWGIVNIV